MNYFRIALFLVVSIHLNVLTAQTIERCFSAGFQTTIELIKPYGADKWLLAGAGEPEPGAYFRDTLFVAIVGADGQVHLRKNLNMPTAEIHYWHDIRALPDGGILAAFESTLCDVGADVITVQCLDASGQLRWQMNGGFVFGTTRPPDRWFVAPDGNLLGVAFDQIWKVDPDNGEILYKASLENVVNGSAVANELVIIPGSEDFIGIGDPDYQVWTKSGNPGEPVYILSKELELDGFRKGLTFGSDGNFYSVKYFPDEQLERVDQLLQYQALPSVVLDVDFTQTFTVGELGIYAFHDGWFNRYDFDGTNPVLIPTVESWIQCRYMTAANGQIVLCGSDRSGWPYHIDPPSVQSESGWMRSFSESEPNLADWLPDVAVTAVEQWAEIDTIRYVFPSGNVYDLSGGAFRVQVANQGVIPVQQLNVNTSFGNNQFFVICYNYSAQQKTFSSLNLAPGESVWLDFGDIQAIGQAELPTEICFWPSSPNQKPDQVRKNDRTCHPATYTVAVKNPVAPAFSLSPAPADTYVEVTFAENPGYTPWQLWDATGKCLRSGTCPDGGGVLRIETAGLPAGFYLFSAGNRAAKLMVQH
ncbi:MAG: hypothetical protein SFV22_14335 [Saprospiraceae bacterium]|nr:hypothetical protein [Saprospiraceae bacterium]